MKKNIVLFLRLTLAVAFASWLFFSCKQIDVFEKNSVVPDYKWAYSWKPSFEFDISDTSKNYQVYIVLRHTDAYPYNNIWLNIGTQFPGDSSIKNQRLELGLGSDAQGWEGTGMDDIWEIRKAISPGPIPFNKPGAYTFTVAQIMRVNPLPNILSVGIRVEKVSQ